MAEVLAVLIRLLLVAVLMASHAHAQTQATVPPVTIPTTAEWVGPLEWTQDRPRGGAERRVFPTRATLTFGENNRITGDWRSLTTNVMSGEIAGSVDAHGRMRITVTFAANAQQYDLSGRPTTIEIERCRGTARFEGTILPTGVLRWTSDVLTTDTALNRLREQDCDNPYRLIWTLQQRD